MRYTWMDEYLTAKRGVTKDLQPEWNWIRYHVGGRMFAAILLDDGNEPFYINLKLEPAEGELLRSQYADILPGYYSNKRHWNSIRADGEVPDALVRALLDESYRLTLRGLGGAGMRKALGLTCCGASCGECPLYGKTCEGCNGARGRVFHAPKDKPCPIYACCVNRRHRPSCGGCAEAPCAVWLGTRDPSMTDEAFDASVRERLERLEGI